jgi:hypothetical protein
MADLPELLFALAALFVPLACAWLIVRHGARRRRSRSRRPPLR